MREYGFSVTRILRIRENTGEYGRIRVTENPYSRIFYAVKDVNVTVFNMITKINEAKTFVKHNSCDCKCKFDSRACNSNQK